MLTQRDGSSRRTVVDEGFNYWPVFSPDGKSIYFVQRTVPLYEDGSENVWAAKESGGGLRKITDLPAGWSVRPIEMTEDGYLAMVAWMHEACPRERKCADKLVVLDVDAGRVIYISAEQGVAKFLGFLP